MPPPRMRGDGRKAKDPRKTLLRLLGYLKKYWYILAIVAVCIVLTAVAQTNTSAALGSLVDKYILPMVASGSSDYSGSIHIFTLLKANQQDHNVDQNSCRNRDNGPVEVGILPGLGGIRRTNTQRQKAHSEQDGE